MNRMRRKWSHDTHEYMRFGFVCRIVVLIINNWKHTQCIQYAVDDNCFDTAARLKKKKTIHNMQGSKSIANNIIVLWAAV